MKEDSSGRRLRWGGIVDNSLCNIQGWSISGEGEESLGAGDQKESGTDVRRV